MYSCEKRNLKSIEHFENCSHGLNYLWDLFCDVRNYAMFDAIGCIPLEKALVLKKVLVHKINIIMLIVNPAYKHFTLRPAFAGNSSSLKSANNLVRPFLPLNSH